MSSNAPESFTQYIVTKDIELQAIAAYIGKDEADKFLANALQSMSGITSTSAIKDPCDYIVLAAELVKKRKSLMFYRSQLANDLDSSLTKLSAKLGQQLVSDRLSVWIAKYNLRANCEVSKVEQIADIATIEKLIATLNKLAIA